MPLDTLPSIFVKVWCEMQNADYIRSLSNKELTQFVRNINLLGCGATCAYADFCQIGTRLWVEQKYEERKNELGSITIDMFF